MRYYKRIDAQNKITTVESYSHDFEIKGAIEISEAEYKSFINSLPLVIQPVLRDIASELDELKITLKSKGII